MKVGIFGGSFDPVHKGHVNLVERAIEFLKLDKMIVIPAYTSPFKTMRPCSASPQDRLEMVRIAFEGQKGVIVSDIEIKRGVVSYTIETLRELKILYPNDKLFLLLTDESASRLEDWKEHQEIPKLAKIVVFSKNTEIDGKPIPWIDISSTQIRQAIREKNEYKQFLFPKVLDYIERHHLYS